MGQLDGVMARPGTGSDPARAHSFLSPRPLLWIGSAGQRPPTVCPLPPHSNGWFAHSSSSCAYASLRLPVYSVLTLLPVLYRLQGSAQCCCLPKQVPKSVAVHRSVHGASYCLDKSFRNVYKLIKGRRPLGVDIIHCYTS